MYTTNIAFCIPTSVSRSSQNKLLLLPNLTTAVYSYRTLLSRMSTSCILRNWRSTAFGRTCSSWQSRGRPPPVVLAEEIPLQAPQPPHQWTAGWINLLVISHIITVNLFCNHNTLHIRQYPSGTSLPFCYCRLLLTCRLGTLLLFECWVFCHPFHYNLHIIYMLIQIVIRMTYYFRMLLTFVYLCFVLTSTTYVAAHYSCF